MRIVFAGSPAAAVPSLRALAAEHDIAAVITRAPSPVGRKRVLTATAVGQAAAELGLPIIETNRLDAATTEQIRALQVDLGVIVAYGGLVREPLLSLPTHGWINLHFSLLPAYRGAAPVQAALLDGVTETGVAIFTLVPELDAGPVHRQLRVPIAPMTTAGELLESLADLGASELLQALTDIDSGSVDPQEQRGTPTFAPKLSLADGRLDPAENATAIVQRYCAVTPEPGAHVVVGGERVKVLELELSDSQAPAVGEIVLDAGVAVLGTASGTVQLVTVQPPGKRPMRASDWLRGRGGTVEVDR